MTVFAQKQIPDITVKTLEGEAVKMQEIVKDGKIRVISFWATWCSPCKKELDAIAEVYDEWKEQYNMEIIAVTIDDVRGLSKVKPMLAQKGWSYRVLSDVNKDLMNALNFQNVPQTFLLDREGNITYTHSGYVPGDEIELEEKIKAIAGK